MITALLLYFILINNRNTDIININISTNCFPNVCSSKPRTIHNTSFRDKKFNDLALDFINTTCSSKTNSNLIISFLNNESIAINLKKVLSFIIKNKMLIKYTFANLNLSQIYPENVYQQLLNDLKNSYISQSSVDDFSTSLQLLFHSIKSSSDEVYGALNLRFSTIYLFGILQRLIKDEFFIPLIDPRYLNNIGSTKLNDILENILLTFKQKLEINDDHEIAIYKIFKIDPNFTFPIVEFLKNLILENFNDERINEDHFNGQNFNEKKFNEIFDLFIEEILNQCNIIRT